MYPYTCLTNTSACRLGAWQSILAQFLAVALLLCLSAVLVGCIPEQQCHWNTDIKIKGCDRFDFAHCVTHYCTGCASSFGSSECEQLKCGAFCAKRHGDECISNYRELCEFGASELEYKKLKHNSDIGKCDVDCSSSQRSSSVAWFKLILLVLGSVHSVNFSTLGGTTCLFHAVAFCALGMLLQGCSDCGPRTPQQNDWEVDLKLMDRLAGCKDEWNPLWGNPCASDYPILFAKKGVNFDSDSTFIKERVENEQYHCMKWAIGGYCQEWTAKESSCDEQDFGLCQCTKEHHYGKFCEEWQCMTEEASQQLCWDSCCGDGCTPCVLCGLTGSDPLEMNLNVYNDLLSAKGINHFSHSNLTELQDELRTAWYGEYDLYGTCIAPRDIQLPSEIQCGTWREIETELSHCWCKQADSSKDFCASWTCEEKDVGQFSILFSRQMSYDKWIEGQETEEYTCIETRKKTSGDLQCSRWKGEIGSYEEVELTQCSACKGMEVEKCESWICDEYEIHRVHDVDQWWKRFLWSLFHGTWMTIGLAFFAALAGEPWDEVWPCVTCCLLCILLILLFLIYCAAFARNKEGYTQMPGMPWLGLLLQTLPAFLIGSLPSLRSQILRIPLRDQTLVQSMLFCIPEIKGGDSSRCSNFALMGILLVPYFPLIGLAWTTGLIIPIICFIGMLGCVGGYNYLSSETKEMRKVQPVTEEVEVQPVREEVEVQPVTKEVTVQPQSMGNEQPVTEEVEVQPQSMGRD